MYTCTPATRGVLILAALLLASGYASFAAGADDYISAVTAEGERLETLGKARREEERLRQTIERRRQSPPPAAAAKAPAQDLPTTPTRAQFEQELRREFPYSYALYVLLTEKEKDEVYGEFLKGRDGGAAWFLPALKKIVGFSAGQHDPR